MKQITLKMSDGERTVDAVIRVQLAYHLMLDSTDYYAVTHVKSGLNLFNYLERREAQKIVKALSVVDFDGYYDAGCPKGYLPEEHKSIWRDLREKY